MCGQVHLVEPVYDHGIAQGLGSTEALSGISVELGLLSRFLVRGLPLARGPDTSYHGRKKHSQFYLYSSEDE